MTAKTSTNNTPRAFGQIPVGSVPDFPAQYQGKLGSHSGYESVDVSVVDSRSPRICGNSTRSAPASDCVATRHQEPLHPIEGATTSQDHGSLFPRRPNMQEGSTQYFHRPSALPQGGSEPVSPPSRRVSSQIEIDNDSTAEDDGDDDDDDEMLVTADEQDYDRETIDDGAPKTAEEIRAEKRKQKRFRYLQAGRPGKPLSLLFRLTHNQTRFLQGEFTRQAHPDAAQRERLSREIPGLSPRQVQVWFQNR